MQAAKCGASTKTDKVFAFQLYEFMQGTKIKQEAQLKLTNPRDAFSGQSSHQT